MSEGLQLDSHCHDSLIDRNLGSTRLVAFVLGTTLTCDLTHLLTYLFIHSLTHLLAHSLTHSLTHSLIRAYPYIRCTGFDLYHIFVKIEF